MPLDNISYRAEIGLFYNTLNYFFQPTKNYTFSCFLMDLRCAVPSMHHMTSFLILLFLFPFIFLVFRLISDHLDVTSLFRVSYRCVYVLVRIVINFPRCLKAIRKYLVKLFIQYVFFLQIFTFLPYVSLLLSCGDIEVNPGPENSQNLSFCHWNVNGITANNFKKLSLIEAYNAVHSFDIICISETFLNSDYSLDDPRLMLDGYIMRRSDHPSGAKQGVYVYIIRSICRLLKGMI